MAIVRCQDHPPRNTNYVIAVEPVGYPESALVCGREDKHHDKVGWVYLLSGEYEEYQEGQRVFTLWGPNSSSGAAKVRVSDNSVNRLDEWSEGQKESTTQLHSQSSIDRY